MRKTSSTIRACCSEADEAAVARASAAAAAAATAADALVALASAVALPLLSPLRLRLRALPLLEPLVVLAPPPSAGCGVHVIPF